MRGPDRSIRALDAATGEILWEAPGESSYGDVLALGDGIVAVIASGRTEIVGYELDSGDERWRIDVTGLGEPQLIAGSTLVLLWEGALSAVSTSDGSTLWSTDQPFGLPFWNNVGAFGSSVFVAVNARPWSD